MVYEALLYEKEDENDARCGLCAHCSHLLIGRFGFSIERLDLKESACPRCGTPLDGIF